MGPAGEQEIVGDIGADIYCPGCGYDLRGATGMRCSECGYSLVNMRSPECGIPWEHRRKLGRRRAFWQTVWLVTFRNRRFCEEYAHKVSFSDARWFQLVTVLHVYLPVLALTVLLYATTPSLREPEVLRQLIGLITPHITAAAWLFAFAYDDIWPMFLLHLGLLAFLIATTGVVSYFFHPKAIPVDRQNSAVAMSLYTCGPFAVLPVPAALFLCYAAVCIAVFESATSQSLKHAHAIASLLTATLGVVVIAAWYTNAVGLLRRTMPQLKTRAASLVVGLPVLWISLAVLFVFALPFVVLYIPMFIASFGD